MSETSPPPLPLACRFVTTDQWLVTHAQPSWTIAQVKQALLAKFFPAHTTSPLAIPVAKRRARPLSPITFGNDGEESDGSDTQSEREFDFLKYKYTPMPSASATPGASSQPAELLAEKYALVSFSTGQLLEDHFSLSWYGFRPYELLELHVGPGLVSLPRDILDHYIQPYFEARVWALRDSHEISLDMPMLRKRKTKRREEGDEETGKERGRRKRMEWKERWLVIHRGVMKLCNYRDDPTPGHVAPLSGLLALRGAEHLHPHLPRRPKTRVRSPRPPSPRSPSSPLPMPIPIPSNSVRATSPGEDSDDTQGQALPPSRIVCARFKVESQPAVHTRPSLGALSAAVVTGERPSLDGWWRRGSREELSSKWDEAKEDEERREDETAWVVMDLLTEEAYTNILRILHRHAPPTCQSSFFPGSAEPSPAPHYTFPPTSPSSSTASPPFSPPTSLVTATESLRIGYPDEVRSRGRPETRSSMERPKVIMRCPYPDWRTNLVKRARRAGLGEVGRAMELVMFGADAEILEGPFARSPQRRRTRAPFRTDDDDAETLAEIARSQEGEDDLIEYEEAVHPNPEADDPMWSEPVYPASPMEGSGRPNLFLDGDLSSELMSSDSDTDVDGTSEVSQREWEDWASDLPRQRLAQVNTPSVPQSPQKSALVGMRRARPGDWDTKRTSTVITVAVGEAGPSSPPRTLASYSSADSALWHAMRASPERAGPGSPSGSGTESPRSVPAPLPLFGSPRSRSPMSALRDEDAPFSSYAPTMPETVSTRAQSYESTRGKVPMTMAMTTITSTVSVGHAKDEKRKKKGKDREKERVGEGKEKKAKKLTKDKDKGKERAGRTDSPERGHSASAAAALLRPAKLKLSMGFGSSTAPVAASLAPPSNEQLSVVTPVSATSLSSLDSLRFVTPESSD